MSEAPKTKAKARTFAEATMNRSEPETEVLLSQKWSLYWEYCDNMQEIQELEIKSRKLRNRNEKLADWYPELLQVKGLADRMFNTKIFNILDGDNRVWIHAKDKEEAHEELSRRKESKKKEKERAQKAKKKKPRTAGEEANS